MDFSSWDTAFNVLLLVFWIRIWFRDEREAVFNPYLAATNRFASSVLHFLRPAFLMLPDRLVAAIAMLLICFLRAFAAPRSANGWVLNLGFEARQAFEGSLTPFLAFTLLSFAIFLFKLWSVSLIFLRADSAAATDHTHAALHAICRPWVAIPYALRPLALLLFGLAITVTLNLTGYPTQANPQLPGQLLTPAMPVLAAPLFWQCFVSTISGWVSVLHTLVNALVVLIIMSWVGMLTGAHGISAMCRDWTDMLIGPLRNYPLRIGMLDLTPIVFILLVNLIHGVLQAFLFAQYVRLVQGG